MTSSKISVKLFVQNDLFGPTEFVPVFHRWIQDQSLQGHALIDVADYAHVPAGPGTLVVAVEANIHMDRVDNRFGLLYLRKTSIDGPFRDKLTTVLVDAFRAAAKMEAEPEFVGRLKFRTDEILIRIHDRLQAPNSPETFATAKGDVEAALKDFLAADVSLSAETDEQKLFGVVAKCGQSEGVVAVLDRAASPVVS